MDQCLVNNHYAWIGVIIYSMIETYLGKSEIIKPGSVPELIWFIIVNIFNKIRGK
jgi:hypothetical protein